MTYNPAEIEGKWQKIWEESQAFQAKDNSPLPKYYCLVEFPYPSGQGLHVGHPRSYTALDVIARKRRMEGYNVLYPMGWDAFGLPTENYAIKTGIQPAEITQQNIARYRQQLKILGISFDWSREIDTTDPAYYRWTQWIFLRLFEQGLAEKAEIPINWCPSCKTGLANEEVVNDACERCGGVVETRNKSQWLLKITKYAHRLLEDLENLDFQEKIKTQQQNWIGRQTGALVTFQLQGQAENLEIFTARPETLPRTSFLVIAPEHPLLDLLASKIANWPEVTAYRAAARTNSPDSGVPLLGLQGVSPLDGRLLPLWVADYIPQGGTRMAVPGEDPTDRAFAQNHNLPILEDTDDGDAETILARLKALGAGREHTTYHLRDWVFSRQRYWGEPIPLVHCEKCRWVPLKDTDLPLLLPETVNFHPTDQGDSPLAALENWVNTPCPRCGGPGRRETDTMPNWAGSSWYFLRYTDPHNDRRLAGRDKLDYWLPVDWYNGGMEHTTLHLLYARFWHKFLYDIGIVSCPEPFKKRTSHGMILADNNEKMSKSRGNVINPDEVVAQYGADTLRLYELFIGAFDQATPWSQQGILGCRRFLEKVWRLKDCLKSGDSFSPDLEGEIHRTIKKVSLDCEETRFNTAVAALMSLTNLYLAKAKITRGEYRILLILLNPFAPHITQELWEQLNFKGRLHQVSWPRWDEKKAVQDTVRLAVQVNGKTRGVLVVSANAQEEDLRRDAQTLVSTHLEGKEITREIHVPGKVWNIVAR